MPSMPIAVGVRMSGTLPDGGGSNNGDDGGIELGVVAVGFFQSYG